MSSQHRHFIVYKPYKYLSQFVNNQSRRKNKKLLGELADFPEGIMAIGRLDEKSEGLLLLTTDGKVSDAVRSKSVEKEYAVQVDGLVNNEALTKIRKGVCIQVEGDNYQTLPCQADYFSFEDYFNEEPKIVRHERHGPTSWLRITLTEGKYRQVRKMTAAVGFPTLRLIRIRVGNISIRKNQPGMVQEVEHFSFLA